mgnify:CR=1 FL=1
MRVRTLTGIAALTAGVAAASHAAAQDGPPVPVALAWSAPLGCPSREQVLGEIEQAVGVAPAPKHVTAGVIVSQEGPSFVAVIELGDAATHLTRRVEAESCRAVADAIVLIVSLAVDPDAAPARIRPRADPSPPPRPPAGPRAEEPAPSWLLGGAFVVDASLLSTPTAGGELALGWSAPHMVAELAGVLLAPESVALPANPSQGARVWLAQVSARTCYEAVADRFTAGPCAGAAVAWLSAQGFGGAPDRPTDASAVLPVTAGGARATLRLGAGWAVRVTAEAVVPLERATVFVGGGGVVFRTPVASFRGALGAEVHF